MSTISFVESDIETNTFHALENFSGMYNEAGKTIVCETGANAIDKGSSRWDIKLYEENGFNIFSSYNNGPPFTDKEWQAFHTLADSTKIRGVHFGFAGVGAKLYLASSNDAKIYTETSDGITTKSSIMYVSNNKLKKILRKSTFKEYGTLTKITVKKSDYDYLIKELTNIVTENFSSAIMAGMKITINGNDVQPWNQSQAKIQNVVTVDGKKFPYSLYVFPTVIPESRRNIQWEVDDIRVTTKQPSFNYELKGDSRNKYHVVVDGTEISQYLKTGKDGFQRNKETTAVFSEVEKEIFTHLKNLGFVQSSQGLAQPVANRFTKFLRNTILPKFPWLNPGSNLIIIKPKKKTKGKTKQKHTTKTKTQKFKCRCGPRGGFSVAIVNRPNDPREGWIDPISFQVVINLGHSLAIKFESSVQARSLHIAKVILQVLIKNAAKTGKITVEKAYDTESEILTLSRDEF